MNGNRVDLAHENCAAQLRNAIARNSNQLVYTVQPVAYSAAHRPTARLHGTRQLYGAVSVKL